ncbi:MAG: SWIM zinc finger family protein [Bacteroidetes bacterium]|nr:MAG: SWIM zinc finger family protein [Bacteroidota bacterium]
MMDRSHILALAPDDASAKAGAELAQARRWVSRHSHPKALWGECQGSGKTPYLTYVDLGNTAFKCSCPSRKFPCKHGLGLLLLFAEKKNEFVEKSSLPPEIEAWIEKRAATTEKKEQKETKAAPKAGDEAARLKRIEAREKKIRAGIEELRSWIQDVARTGIMNVPQNPYHFSSHIAARMVDAQAAGLSYQLRKIETIPFYQEGWQKSLIRLLSKIYLMTEAYTYKNTLGDLLREELDTLIGWTKSKEDILAQEGIADQWQILSRQVENEDNLITERVWLYGSASEKHALLLNFYAGNQVPEAFFLPGRSVYAELVFYPAAIPQRALVKKQGVSQPPDLPQQGISRTGELLNQVADVLAASPFCEKIPFVLSGFRIVMDGTRAFFLCDEEAIALPLANTEESCWQMLALSKGLTFNCFATYENQQLRIHSLWKEQHFFAGL